MLLLLLLLISSQLFGQEEKSEVFPFEKGKLFTGLDISGGGSAYFFKVKNEAKIGYFVLKGLAVGGGLSGEVHARNNFFNNRSRKYDLELSAFARYYIPKTKGLFLEFEAGEELAIQKWADSDVTSKTWSTNLNYSLGYSIMVGKKKNWSLEPKVTYEQNFSSNYRTYHDVNLSIGFRYFFNRKKKK